MSAVSIPETSGLTTVDIRWFYSVKPPLLQEGTLLLGFNILYDMIFINFKILHGTWLIQKKKKKKKKI